MTVSAGQSTPRVRSPGGTRPDCGHGVDAQPTPVRTTVGVPAEVGAFMRPRVRDLVQQTAAQIQHEVGAYAGSPRGRRRRLIEAAVSGAVHDFVDGLEGRHVGRQQVDDLFRRMGRGEALDGNSLGAMREALEIATRDAWGELRTVAVAAGLSAAALGHLGDLLFELIDHLGDQVSIGYHAAQAEIGQATLRARSELLTALLAQRPQEELEPLALRSGWPLPERYVVVVAASDRRTAAANPVLADPELLFGLVEPVSIGVLPLAEGVDPSGMPERVEELLGLPGIRRIALSWPMSREELADGVRWGRRALRLADQGVLPDQEILICQQHTTALWLHAEPLLSRQIARDLLEPLMQERPHSRVVLSRTLLAWLSSHDSAPALAQQLGVHPQTVRYRLRRLHTLLGDRLDDPHARLSMRLALEAGL